jgi:hypothetical protein
MLPAKNLTSLANREWLAKSSLHALLQRQELASVTRFVCEQPHSLSGQARKTDRRRRTPRRVLAPSADHEYQLALQVA